MPRSIDARRCSGSLVIREEHTIANKVKVVNTHCWTGGRNCSRTIQCRVNRLCSESEDKYVLREFVENCENDYYAHT